MKYFKTDIAKVLESYKQDDISLEEAVQKACVAYDKEVSNPTEESIEDRRAAFKDRIRPFAEVYPAAMLEKFYTYWTGFKTPQAKLMEFEKAKTFNMAMRLRTWQENQKKFALKRYGK